MHTLVLVTVNMGVKFEISSCTHFKNPRFIIGYVMLTVLIIIFIRHMTGQQGMKCTNSGPTKYH